MKKLSVRFSDTELRWIEESARVLDITPQEYMKKILLNGFQDRGKGKNNLTDPKKGPQQGGSGELVEA